MWSAFALHALVVEHEDIAALTATVQHLQEAVADVGVFQFMAGKLLGEYGLSSPWLGIPSGGAVSSCPVILLGVSEVVHCPSSWLQVVKVRSWCGSWMKQGSSWCQVVTDPVLSFLFPVIGTIFFDLVLTSRVRPGSVSGDADSQVAWSNGHDPDATRCIFLGLLGDGVGLNDVLDPWSWKYLLK